MSIQSNKLVNLADAQVLYNDLRDRDSSLKSALYPVRDAVFDYIDTPEFTKGYIINSSGVAQTTSSYRCAEFDFIKVEAGDIITIDSGWAFNISRYTSADQSAFISGSYRTFSADPFVIQNSCYIRCSVKKDDDSDFNVSDAKNAIHFNVIKDSKIDVLKNDLSGVEEKTDYIYRDKIGKNLFDKDSENIVTNHYLATNGTEEELSGWNISDYIPVAGLSAIVGSVWTSDLHYYTYSKLNYLHTYRADKSHIEKIWDQTNTDGVYTVGENVAYIRFCWQPNNDLSDGKLLMIESGSVHSSYYSAYTSEENTFLKESAYPTRSEVIEMIKEGGVEQDAISCWGDSLTYSHNTNIQDYPYIGDVTYPSKLAELTGLNAANIGMPGANAMDISGLQGGMPIYLDPFTLPADTSSVEVTLKDAEGISHYIGLMHWSPRAGWPNPIFDMGLTWKIGNLPVNLSYSGSAMKVRRLTAAQSATVFSRPVRIDPVHDYATEKIQIFFVGTNDAPSTQADAERLCRIIQNMVRFSAVKRYMVIGLTVKSYADAVNDLLAQTFGNNYVDVKSYMINYGLSDNPSITPTAQDETDIGNNVIPSSLRSDSVHFNDAGYTAIANCIYQHGQMLGYWD